MSTKSSSPGFIGNKPWAQLDFKPKEAGKFSWFSTQDIRLHSDDIILDLRPRSRTGSIKSAHSFRGMQKQDSPPKYYQARPKSAYNSNKGQIKTKQDKQSAVVADRSALDDTNSVSEKKDVEGKLCHIESKLARCQIVLCTT